MRTFCQCIRTFLLDYGYYGELALYHLPDRDGLRIVYDNAIVGHIPGAVWNSMFVVNSGQDVLTAVFSHERKWLRTVEINNGF